MFATTIRFTMPPDTDWERLRQLAIRRAFEVYRSMPGLRAKAFIFSPERSEFGGNYVWDTQDDAESYLRSPAWRTTVAALGEPEIERTEVEDRLRDALQTRAKTTRELAITWRIARGATNWQINSPTIPRWG